VTAGFPYFVAVIILAKFTLINRWESAVGTATRLRDREYRNRGLIPGRGMNFISSPKRRDSLRRAPISYSMDTRSLLERPGPVADHSPPFNAEVKNGYKYSSAPACSIMAEDSFTFIFKLINSDSKFK
jgi:hypothetical protein